MRILIIEDELSIAKRLKKLILEIDSDFEVVDILESVEESIEWFESNEKPDLIFMDIQLSDGTSLEILERVNTNSFIIFTTAYNEYAIKAFKYNSIDYLLKPISKKDLTFSIEKFKRMVSVPQQEIDIVNLLNHMNKANKTYKSRFLIRIGQSSKTILTEKIAYFFIKNQLVYLNTFNDETYSIDLSLDELEKRLDPISFFRINRQVILSINSIDEIFPYFNSRLKLKVHPEMKEEVIVSREKTKEFKNWLDA